MPGVRAEDWAAICAEYEAGHSCSEIGPKYNVAPGTIRRGLKLRGVQVRGHKASADARAAWMRNGARVGGKSSPIPNDVINALAAEYKSGVSAYELQRKYGYDSSTLISLFRRRGVEIRRKVAKEVNLSEHDRIYIAALVDGEGYITVSVHKSTSGGTSTNYSPCVGVVNTKESVMRWLHDLCGGGLTIVESSENPEPGIQSRKTCYRWATTGEQCAAVLRQILPWMKMKDAQARLAIELAERRAAFLGKTAKLPQEEMDARRRIQDEIIRLNGRKRYKNAVHDEPMDDDDVSN